MRGVEEGRGEGEMKEGREEVQKEDNEKKQI